MNFILKFTALSAFLILFSFSSNAQADIVETSFEVSGVCNGCKKRIENAAQIKGVKLAEWDKHTQLLKVVYKSTKVDLPTIQESIAAVGHDTGEVKAKDEVYKELPGCCHYRDGIEVH